MSYPTSFNHFDEHIGELAGVGNYHHEEPDREVRGHNTPTTYHTPLPTFGQFTQLSGLPNPQLAYAQGSGFRHYSDLNSGFPAHPASDGILFGESPRRAIGPSSVDRNAFLTSRGFQVKEGPPGFLASNGFQIKEERRPGFDEPTLSTNTLTHSSESSTLGSPSSPLLPSARRKRPRDRDSLSPGFYEHESKRATGTSASARSVTPLSTSSFGLLNDPDLARILGGDPREHMAELIEDQRKQESMLEARRIQEAQDAEYARLLSREVEDEAAYHPPTVAPTPAASSSFSARQTILSGPNRYRLPSPTAPITPTQPVKQLPAGPLTMGHHSPRSFIDLSSDDEGDGGAVKKEDLTEIDRSAFRPNDRSLSRHPFAPSGSPGQHQISRSALPPVYGSAPSTGSAYAASNGKQSSRMDLIDLAHHARSGAPGPGLLTPGSSQNRPGHSAWPAWMPDTVAAAARGVSSVASAAYGLVDRQIQEYPAAFAGGASHPPTTPMGPVGRLASQYGEYDYDDMGVSSATTAAELQALLGNILPEEGLDPRTRLGTPDAMTEDANLYEHQKLGLAWLIKMEEGSNKGGILADDMGLGKTIQAIALMVSRRSEAFDRKTTLIVAPVALMRQWESEIKNKIKPEREYRLSVYLYHGQGTKTTWDQLKLHDVVLTTYGTLAAEYSRKLRIDELRTGNPDFTPGPQERLPLLGDSSRFYRVILDEAQNIKNKATKAAKATHCVQSLTRFCMTGTPMMNSVEELYSLINFLRIRPYSEFNRFNQDFVRPLKRASQQTRNNAMKKLQVLLKAILLRRTKQTQVDGKPIIELPERTTTVEHVVFDEEEEKVYRALETSSQLVLSRYLKEGTVMRNYSNVLVLLLRLRQACCHPHLMTDFAIPTGVANAVGEVTVEDSIRVARGLPPAVVTRLKESGVADCPICMDVTDNATIFDPCGHATCSECFAKISDPSAGRNDHTDSFKCPNCRGMVKSKVVTDWTTFRKVHCPAEPDGNAIDDQAADDHVSEGDIATESDSDSDSDDASSDGLPAWARKDDGGQEGHEQKSHKTAKGKQRARKEGKDKPTLAQLRKASKKNVAAKRRYLRRLEKEFVPSSKITKVIELLEEIQERQNGEKSIVFSQFTSLLDLLEVPLSQKGWDYQRYDGSMSANARNDAVLDFTNQRRCKLMLVSLKAGNAGLNLTVASNVILLDPFWNPYIEEQAVDRCHRIGQRRPVQVHRLLVASTVEDRIIELQEKKRALIEGALDEGASRTMGRLGVRELTYLFGLR